MNGKLIFSCATMAIVVLLCANKAHGVLKISVNGEVDPFIKGSPFDTFCIGIWSDGDQPQPNFTAIVAAAGDGRVTGGTMCYSGSLARIYDLTGSDLVETTELLRSMGYFDITSVIVAEVSDSSPTPLPLGRGMVADLILFNGSGIYPANIWLLNRDSLELYDTQFIEGVPEPATVMLFVAGVIWLRNLRS
jgi:hypothetical protein